MWYTRPVSDSESVPRPLTRVTFVVSHSDIPLAFRTSLSICRIVPRSYGWDSVVLVTISVAVSMLELWSKGKRNRLTHATKRQDPHELIDDYMIKKATLENDWKERPVSPCRIRIRISVRSLAYITTDAPIKRL